MVGKSILIVDENPASRIYLANYLKGKQFKVLEAPTGKEGLIVTGRDQPDRILFDPMLHDSADQEFIHRLWNDPRTINIRLVAFSADPGAARRETCLGAGVNESLAKSAQALPRIQPASFSKRRQKI